MMSGVPTRSRRRGFVLAEVLWSGSAILALTTMLAVVATRTQQSDRDRTEFQALTQRLDRVLAAGRIVVDAEGLRFDVEGVPPLRPGDAQWGVIDARPVRLRWERGEEVDRLELEIRSRGRRVRTTRWISHRLRLRFVPP